MKRRLRSTAGNRREGTRQRTEQNVEADFFSEHGRRRVMNMQVSGDRKNNFHMIRLLAALFVLSGYMSPILGLPGILIGCQNLQNTGIQILFLIGGYLAAESWRRDGHAARFLLRRFVRVWPPCAVMVLIMCLIAGPLVSDLGVRGYFHSWWKSYLMNLRFYIIYSQPGVFTENPISQVTNGALWTLPVGVLVYLITPLLMAVLSFFDRERDAFRAFGILTALLCAADVLFGWRGDLHLVLYATDWVPAFHMIVLYVIGMLCSFNSLKALFNLQYTPIALSALVLTAMLRHPQVQQLVWLIALPVLVFPFALAQPPLFQHFGLRADLSYGIYLYGFFFQQLVCRWNMQGERNWSYMVCLMISLMMTVPAAFLSSVLIEKPLRKATEQFLQNRKEGRKISLPRIRWNPDWIRSDARLCPCRQRCRRGAAIAVMLVIIGLLWHARPIFWLISSGIVLLSSGWILLYRRSLVSEGLWFAVLVLSAGLMVVYCQYSLGAAYQVPLFSPGAKNFFLGALSVFTLLSVLTALTGRVRPSLVAGILVCAVLTAVDVYVLRFRGNELTPADLRSIRTAMGVAGHYRFLPPPRGLLEATLLLVSYLFLLFLPQEAPRMSEEAAKRRYVRGSWPVRIGYALFAAGAVLILRPHMQAGKPEFFFNEGATRKGFYYNFALQFKSSILEKPEEYDWEKTPQLYEKQTGDSLPAGAGSAADGAHKARKPSIVVIMNESFADLRNLDPALYDGEDVLPVLSSVNDGAVSGKALVSTFGGGTPNTEFEFLTGFSEAWLPSDNITYQQYIRPGAYSLLTELNRRGYRCVAMHPARAQSWNRQQVYPALGFDEMYFLEAFPEEGYLRGYLSDEEMYAFLTDYYGKHIGEPQFLFAVTIQNHGGYLYEGEDYTQEIQAEDLQIPNKELAQYVDLIHRSDRALENLITFFSEQEEDVVLVFFGDHLPAFAEKNIYADLKGESGLEGLALQVRDYEVPFLIWANYPIEESKAEEISMSYLSSLMLETAGMDIPAWNRYLLKLQEKIPAMNRFAYYSKDADRYQWIEEAEAEEREYLENYRMLQYNGFVDTRHRNPSLFPSYLPEENEMG